MAWFTKINSIGKHIEWEMVNHMVLMVQVEQKVQRDKERKSK